MGEFYTTEQAHRSMTNKDVSPLAEIAFQMGHLIATATHLIAQLMPLNIGSSKYLVNLQSARDIPWTVGLGPQLGWPSSVQMRRPDTPSGRRKRNLLDFWAALQIPLTNSEILQHLASPPEGEFNLQDKSQVIIAI